MLLKFLQYTQLLQQRHTVLRSLLIQIQAVVIRLQQCRLQYQKYQKERLQRSVKYAIVKEKGKAREATYPQQC